MLPGESQLRQQQSIDSIPFSAIDKFNPGYHHDYRHADFLFLIA
jgi:hypothetical protein